MPKSGSGSITEIGDGPSRAVKLWEMEEGKAIRSWTAHTGNVLSVALRPCGLNHFLRRTPTNGKFSNFRTGLKLEFISYMTAVGFNRLATYAEALANFIGGKPLTQQPENLKLAIRNGAQLASFSVRMVLGK